MNSLRPAQDHELRGLPVPGEVFAGKYRVERILGRGGMGVVMAAHHELLDQRVALKMLLADAATRPDSLTRFLNEGRAAARIQNQHVAKVMDVDRAGEITYLAMEFLEGEDLAEVLARHKQLRIDVAVDHMLQACEGLAHAHARSVIHRDLKPANIFVSRQFDDTVITKVVDFGISVVATSEKGDSRVTSTRSVVGSPVYMSPEQIRSSRSVDPRTDIWSLGIVLYELLTGQTPFNGETFGEVFAAILEDAPIPPQSRRADIPKGLEAVILQCLQPKRELRYENVAELAEALVPFGSGTWAECAPRARIALDRARATSAGGKASSAKLPSGVQSPAIPPPPKTPAIPQVSAVIDRSLSGVVSEEPPLAAKPRVKTAHVIATGAAAMLVGVGLGLIAMLGDFSPAASLDREARTLERHAKLLDEGDRDARAKTGRAQAAHAPAPAVERRHADRASLLRSRE